MKRNDDTEWVASPYIECLDRIVTSLEPAFTNDLDPEEMARLDTLEYVLRSTAKLLAERQVSPAKESDIQREMNIHLESTFADYTPTLTISKPIKSFKPDGGVISLKAAIEFKFVDSKKELKTALSGIREDFSGYSSSEE